MLFFCAYASIPNVISTLFYYVVVHSVYDVITAHPVKHDSVKGISRPFIMSKAEYTVNQNLEISIRFSTKSGVYYLVTLA